MGKGDGSGGRRFGGGRRGRRRAVLVGAAARRRRRHNLNPQNYSPQDEADSGMAKATTVAIVGLILVGIGIFVAIEAYMYVDNIKIAASIRNF